MHVWNNSVVNDIDGPIAAVTSGTFTITRTGDILAGYYDSTELFQETETGNLDSIAFTLQNNNHSTDDTSVTFTNFSLTADSVPNSTPEPSTIWLLGGAVILAGLGKFVRRPKAV